MIVIEAGRFKGRTTRHLSALRSGAFTEPDVGFQEGLHMSFVAGQ